MDDFRVSVTNFKYWAEKQGWLLAYEHIVRGDESKGTVMRFVKPDGDYYDCESINGYIRENSLE